MLLSGLRFQHYKNHKLYDHVAEAEWLGSVERPNWTFVTNAWHTEAGEIVKVYQNANNCEYVSEKDLGELTIYRADYHDESYGYGMVWARPSDMFWGEVEIEKGESVSRFRLIR